MKVRLSLVLAAAIAAAGCARKEEPPPPPKKQEGRAETQTIRNTEAIGYSGKQIADKVDGGLNAYDKRSAEKDEKIEEATE